MTVIEEFDNGLHPSRAKLLVQHLASTAEQRRLNAANYSKDRQKAMQHWIESVS